MSHVYIYKDNVMKNKENEDLNNKWNKRVGLKYL